ncbi:hypothetical protein H4S06_002056 [Coemansia sp. BCRC 34490]|nr:hypothetical protein H4S06_002056 [Coemansia sp. BCRC 34490]
MDAFTSTVDSQTIWLNGFDYQGSIMSIPICYWYENKDKDAGKDFMPAEILERAFYMAMKEFPILAGTLKSNASSRLYVEIDKNNLNMPVYTDSFSELDYSKLCKSGYNIRKLPIDLSGEYGVPVPSGLVGGSIKPAHIRIIRFKENSGVLVYASIAHYITDGYGYTQFMNRWSEMSRWLQQDPQGSSSASLPVRRYVHDRSIHDSISSSSTDALDSFVLGVKSGGNLVTRWLAWVSPETRARVFKALSNTISHKCSFFHVSSETMEALRARVQAYAPEGVRYSINDVIASYLAVVVAQAKERASADRWWSKSIPMAVRKTLENSGLRKPAPPPGLAVLIPVNMRTRISHPDVKNYMGVMVSGKGIPFTHEHLQQGPTDKTLSEMALKIHEALPSMNERFAGQVGNLITSEPDIFTRQVLGMATGSRKLIFSNQSRFAHYSVDFGAGIPSMVRHAPHAFNDVVYIMPANPKTGGYEIEFNFAPDVEANITSNNDWMKLVDTYDNY